MPLDGLRAWIGEVERKLGVRTKVMLALAAIAIGIGGTAIYLAIDTRDNAVSESDVRELQEQLEAQMGTGAGGAGTGVAQLESELRALQAEVEELGGKGGTSGQGSGNGATGAAGKAGDASGGASASGAGDVLRELREGAREQAK